MSDKMELRVACVGAGYFSQFHIDSWSRMERATLVGICDRSVKKARSLGKPAFAELVEMIDQTKPDVLDVVVPPMAQAEVLRVAFASGAKAIVCQKPFCRSLSEAKQLCAESEDAGVRLIVHDNFRFQPWYRFIKSEIAQGHVGVLQNMSMRLRPGDGQGTNAYLDRQPYFQKMERFLIHETGVHWIDTFRFLAGDPIAVYADLRRLNPAIAGEDAGFVIFDHAGDVQSLFDGNRHLGHQAENQRITMGEAHFEGSDGVLDLSGDGSVWFRAMGSLERRRIFQTDTSKGFAGDCVHALNTHVVAGLIDGTPLENEANDYLKVLEIEEAIYRSAAEGRKIRL
ncbi:MAG: Gfo/Idh/MocA family protein [Boseongicola sp.]